MLANHFIFALACALFSFAVGAQSLEPSPNPPDQLTPGGLLPQLENVELPRAEQKIFVIPPVREREPISEGGAQLQVRYFDLFIDPVLGRKAGDELNGIVRGFLIDRVVVQPQGGYTIANIESIAADVTELYREAGFFLAWAYIPMQKVKDGIVRINVLPGELGAVNVEGNENYSTSRIVAPFEKLIGEPVESDTLESAVLQVRDFPGLMPLAVLGPGLEVGSSELTLSVAEQPLNFSVTGDNYGTVVNGQYRVIGSLVWNNPLGQADRLKVDILQTFDPAENTYGSIFYESPIARSSWSLGANIYTNQFEVGAVGQNLGLQGESAVAGLFGKKQFKRSRDLNISIDAALNAKRASFDSPFAASGEREDKLSVITLGLNLDTVDSLAGVTGITAFRVWLDLGIADFLGSMPADGNCNSTRQGATADVCDGQTTFKYAGGDFTKFAISLQRLQQITTYNSLLFRAYYQFSSDLLVSLEQVAIGGPFNNRGYPVSQALVDKGGFATFEWTYNFAGRFPEFSKTSGIRSYALWNWFLFTDFGGGEKNDPFPNEEGKIDLSSFGGGLEMAWDVGERSNINFRFELATPIGSTPPLEIDDKDPRYWGRLTYSF
jgi:hemolysin activation/secretion protein